MNNNKKIPSVLNVNAEGNTSSFLRAARSGNLDKVIEHLKNKIDINTSNSNGLNALHLASKDGHLEIVKELLKRGANVNSATKKGNTALHIASLAGQYDVVVTLVEHGALVNVQSQNGFTPLYMAAQENHDRVVKYLLANGANQNLATEDGFTPCAVAMQQGHEKVVTVLLENDTKGKVRLPALHIAAKKDDCKAADLLLQNDHNPDVTSKSGFTPLHIASHYGNDGIAKLLLAKGADVNYSAKHNITPLHVAAKWGKSNMVSLLLESGANIEAKTRDGLTALHCAARSGHDQVIDMLLQRNAPISSKTKNGLAALHMAAQGDHVEAAKVLLSNNAPVDDVTVDYLTGLHVAAHCGHIRVAKLLLEKHADPDARALNGFTPLHIACKKNRIKVVELLLKYNASLEATTESGLTPLHVASFMGCMNIVIFLLQHEANPDLPTVRGETPLHLAARANQTDIIRILLRNGAQVDARAREKQTPLHIASRLGNVDIVMLLLAHGAAVDSTTKDLYTALHIASKEGQEEVASVLLENEASVTATTKKGFTPLHLASKYGNIKVTKLLLQKQAPVDAQGKNGVTPLHVASHYDNQAVALMLLDKQASPHATAKNGHTPLHIAAKKNQMDIAVTLLDYGAKANAESKAGFTPLHLSSQEGNVEMTTLLLNHNADPNYKSKNGLTPMHLTAQEDKHKVAVVLDNYHADINPETKAGFTPLHVACHFGQLNMVRFITARQGVNINATTASGYTPLHQAAQQGHSTIVSHLLDKGADPDLLTSQGQTALSISQKLGYISVVEALKNVTKAVPSSTSDEKYKVISPETMQETFMSDSEDEGGEETMINEQSYRYLTGEEMKGFGDESAPIDVTRDERCDANTVPPTSIDEALSPQTVYDSYSGPVDNVDIVKYPPHVGRLQWKTFLVSFLVDARGGAMRGCRHSGVRVIVPPRRASMPTRVTCRYLRREKLVHPPPLMEGESLASRILELGPVGAKFLGPVMIEVPNFGSLRGSEREIVVLRSENGETWREHTVEVTDEVVKDILGANFDKEDRDPWHSGNRLTRIVTTEFPHYFAIVSRVKQEVHAIGPEGGMVSSTVVPQVQAVFPQGALTKRIKVGLQAQPIPSELTAKLLGNRVAVSPIVTVEPRRRKFHKPITLTLPLPQASSKGMINHYTGDAPTLRLLCSITGGTSRAQWEDVTGSTPLTFINDCVSFTTTVSARFWLMDCRNVADASKMATELYREAIHVPFMAKFVVFAKRTDTNEARIRLFCMTDDREDKTLEHKEHFTEVSNSRDVEVLEGKPVYVEFAGNLVPVTKSGEQLRLVVRAFKENRLPFTMRVKDPSAEPRSWTIIMKEPKVSKNEPAQTPVCVLQFGLPENIVHDTDVNADEHYNNYTYTRDSNTESHKRAELRITDISNFVSDDWINLAHELGFQSSDIAQIQREYPDSSGQQCMSMLNLWMNEISGQDSVIALERALNNIGRVDVVEKCNFAEIGHYPSQNGIYAEPETHQSYQSPNNKYAAEEKAVIEDEIVKTVTERRMEIEQRLNGEPVVIDKKYEPFTRADDAVQMALKPADVPAGEPIEPTEVSFEHKRMSFERGVSIEQVLHEDIPVKDKSVMLEDKKMPSIDEKPIDAEVDVDATSLTFHEKRLSFEQGIPVKEIIQKKTEDIITVPAGHGKDSTTIIETEKSVTKRDTTSAEDAKLSDTKSDIRPSIELTKDTNEQIRRDSILFEEVSQGLVKLDSTGPKVEDKTELLSPQSSRTPPPSPAEFKDIEQQNESKQRQSETVPEKEPQTALWSQDNDDLLDTHGFGEHLNGIETPNLSKPKNHKSLADIDEEFEERSVVLHPFFDQPKRDIFEQVQFIKHHDDSPAFDSPLTDKSVSHHDTGISLTREYSDTLTSSGLKTKPKHTDTAFDEEAELTDNGLSPIQPDEVGLSTNEIKEIKKKIGMYDAGNSPIIFMESIALSPFGTVTSDVATITDNVKKIDVANSPIESNKVQKNMDTTVDVKKMIMQLEKSGAGTENVTSQQSPKRKPSVKPFISGIVLPEEHKTIHVDIEKKHKQYDTNTMNIQSKLDEVIKTEKCVLDHLEKVVDMSSNNNSELESKLLQIVNIETNMLQSFDKIIDKHDKSVNNSCLKNLEKYIIAEKADENLKKVDTTDRLQQSPKKCTEDKIEKKYIDTGYRKEESIMEPIKVTGISKELKKLIDEDEIEQERMYRVLLNETNTNDDKYSNKTPVVEEIITPKRVKPITKKDDDTGDLQNTELYNITTNIIGSIAPIKQKINNNNIKTTNLKENEQLNIEKYKTGNNEILKKDTNDKNKKIFYEEDEEDESDIFVKFTREHLKKALDLSQTNVGKEDNDSKDDPKDIDFDIVDDEENETNNAKKDKSLSFIPKTIEKGLKDITMTLTSIVKKMDVNDMSGKKNENEGGDRAIDIINQGPKQGSGETESNKNKNVKKNNIKNDLKSNITPQTPILKRESFIKNNIKNESIEQCKYNKEKDTKKDIEDSFEKGTNIKEQFKIDTDTNQNNRPVTSTNNVEKQIHTNILTTDKTNVDKTNNSTIIDIKQTVATSSTEIKTLPTKVNSIITNLTIKSEVKPIITENQKTILQKDDSSINTVGKQIVGDLKNTNNLYKKLDINTENDIDKINITTTSYESYEKTERHTKTFILKTNKEHKEIKTTDIYCTTHTEDKLMKDETIQFENLKKKDREESIKQQKKHFENKAEKLIKQKNELHSETTELKNEKVKEQLTVENDKAKQYIEGMETDKIHFDEFYKWVDKLVEEKNDNITKNQNENEKKLNHFKTIRTASIDKEHIEDESSTVKEFISKQVTSKYSNEHENEILKNSKPQTQQTTTETAMILKTKNKVIFENQKTDNETQKNSEKSNLTDIKEKLQQFIISEKENTEIEHEIDTDGPTSNKTSFKYDSEKSTTSDKSNKDLLTFIKDASKMDKILTEKTDSIISDTKDDTKKLITTQIESKETTTHETITEKRTGEKTDLIKSDSVESIKSDKSEKDTEKPTSYKTIIPKSVSKESIKSDKSDKDLPTVLKDASKMDKILTEKTDSIISDTKDDTKKLITTKIESKETTTHETITEKHTGEKTDVIKTEKDTDKPAIDKTSLTKSDSLESVKSDKSDKGLSAVIKDGITLDKIITDKHDSIVSDTKKLITTQIESKETTTHETITEKHTGEKTDLIKSDSVESIKSDKSEKDTEKPTSDKTIIPKSVSKESIKSDKSEKDTEKPTSDKAIIPKSVSKDSIKSDKSDKDLPTVLKDASKIDKILTEKTDSIISDTKDDTKKLITTQIDSKETTTHETITEKRTGEKTDLIKSVSNESIKSDKSEKNTDKPTSDKTIIPKSVSKESIKSDKSEKDTEKPTSDKAIIPKSVSKDSIKSDKSDKDLPTVLKDASKIDKILTEKTDSIISDTKDDTKKLITTQIDSKETTTHETITEKRTGEKTDLIKSDSVESIKSDKSEKDTDKPTCDKMIIPKSVSKDSIKSDKSGKDLPTVLKDASKIDKILTEKTDSIISDTKDDTKKLITTQIESKETTTHETIAEKHTGEKTDLIKSVSNESIKSDKSEKDTDKLTSDKTIIPKSVSKESIKSDKSEKDLPTVLKDASKIDKILTEKTDSIISDTNDDTKKLITTQIDSKETTTHETITEKRTGEKTDLIKSDSVETIKSDKSEKDTDKPTCDKMIIPKSVSKESLKSDKSEKDTDKPTSDKTIIPKSVSKDSIKSDKSDKDLPTVLKDASKIDDIMTEKTDSIISDTKDDTKKLITTQIDSKQTITHESITEKHMGEKTDVIKTEKVIDKPTSDKTSLTKSDSLESVKSDKSDKDLSTVIKDGTTLDKIITDKPDSIVSDTKKLITTQIESKETTTHETITEKHTGEKTDLIKSDSVESIKSDKSEKDTEKPTSDKTIIPKSVSKESIKSDKSDKDLPTVLKDASKMDDIITEKTDSIISDTKDDTKKLITTQIDSKQTITHESITEKHMGEKN
eukprot:XP_008180009.1 PREDICTED: uncharacterized protein LOC100167995 isoform X5 [Acyrthosiphon pisum]